MEKQTCLPRYMHAMYIVLFACFAVSLLVRSTAAYSFNFYNAKMHVIESCLWLRLFQAVGNMNIDAQSLMLATVAKSLVSLGYEVEVSLHATLFSTGCKMPTSFGGFAIRLWYCTLELVKLVFIGDHSWFFRCWQYFIPHATHGVAMDQVLAFTDGKARDIWENICLVNVVNTGALKSVDWSQWVANTLKFEYFHCYSYSMSYSSITLLFSLFLIL